MNARADQNQSNRHDHYVNAHKTRKTKHFAEQNEMFMFNEPIRFFPLISLNFTEFQIIIKYTSFWGVVDMQRHHFTSIYYKQNSFILREGLPVAPEKQ